MKRLRKWFRQSDLAYFYDKYLSYRKDDHLRIGYWPLQAAWLALGWAGCRYPWLARVKRKFSEWR